MPYTISIAKSSQLHFISLIDDSCSGNLPSNAVMYKFMQWKLPSNAVMYMRGPQRVRADMDD